MPHNFLAIDLGAESGCAILATLDGKHLSLTDIHRFPNGPVRLPDGLHWDILRLWSEIKSALRIATHQHNAQLAGIGIDTWGVDYGMLDRAGVLIGNPYHYGDNRTDGMVDEAFKRLPRERIFDLTGIQFMQLNTLYQLFAMAARQSPALYPAHGVDMDESRTPFHIGLDRWVRFDKGDFIGRDSLLRVREKGTSERWVGPIVEGKIAAAAKDRVSSEDQVVGQVLRYMGWLIETHGTDKVRGIVLVARRDQALSYALMAAPNVQVKVFKVHFE